MLTLDQARRIALSFPGAEEASHHGHPDFRVANKIFATLRPEDGVSVVKLDHASQADLVAAGPEVFSLNAWSKQGWTSVRLAAIDAAGYRTVIEAAWRNVAPKKLVAKFDAGG